MGGDQGDGQTGKFLPEPPLEVKAGHAAKLDVRDKDARAVMVRIVQEGLGGEVASHVVTRQAQHAAQRLAHACVVVDDGDEGWNFRHLTTMAEKPGAMV
jgi:hypothetical protein